MFIPSLRRCALYPVLTFAVLLPSAVPAQTLPPKTAVPAPKSVIITIDYVEATLPMLRKASLGLAVGPRHDAQLLAALVRNGAADTTGLTVRCPDGSTIDRQDQVFPARGTTGWVPPAHFESETKAISRLNADGTITLTLTASLTPPPRSAAPFFSTSANLTFQNGQTRDIGETFPVINLEERNSPVEKRAYLIFARAVILDMPPLALFPQQFNPIAPAPPSVDPGMVNNSPFDGDPGMVGGRGMGLEHIERMNVLVLPVLPAPKRK